MSTMSSATFLLSNLSIPHSALACRDFNCHNPDHRDNLKDYYESVTRAIINASVPLRVAQRGKSKCMPGWNEYVRDNHSASLAATQIWRREGMPKYGAIFEHKRNCQKKYKYSIRNAKRNENKIKQNRLAKKLYKGKGRDFWKDIRKIKGNNRVTSTSINGVTGETEICNVWKLHYQKLFNCFEKQPSPSYAVTPHNSAVIEPAELHAHILSLNNTESPGPDGIYAEHLKYGPAMLCFILSKCFTAFFIHGYVPSTILDVQLVPVVKDFKGKLGCIENYRPIAIASCISKLLEVCILSRIENIIEVAENQFGYKKKLGTDSCIFLLKEIINKFKRSNTNMFLAFLDASKAFDRVRHDILFAKLEQAKVPLYIIRLLSVLYSEQTLYVKWNGHISEAFSCSNGVRQGGILSPYLFNFYFNDLSNSLNNLKIGCCLNVVVNHIFMPTILYYFPIREMGSRN